MSTAEISCTSAGPANPEYEVRRTATFIARLTVIASGAGVLFMRPGRYTIGRGRGSDFLLDSPGVSRRQATIEVDERSAVVVDLGSRNGTRVVGRLVDRGPIHHGSVVQFGTTSCVFEWLDQVALDDDPTPVIDDLGAHREPAISPAKGRVLQLLLSGLSEKAIAARLDLSPHTVHNHVKKIYTAYHVNTRSELLAHFLSATY